MKYVHKTNFKSNFFGVNGSSLQQRTLQRNWLIKQVKGAIHFAYLHSRLDAIDSFNVMLEEIQAEQRQDSALNKLPTHCTYPKCDCQIELKANEDACFKLLPRKKKELS